MTYAIDYEQARRIADEISLDRESAVFYRRRKYVVKFCTLQFNYAVTLPMYGGKKVIDHFVSLVHSPAPEEFKREWIVHELIHADLQNNQKVPRMRACQIAFSYEERYVRERQHQSVNKRFPKPYAQKPQVTLSYPQLTLSYFLSRTPEEIYGEVLNEGHEVTRKFVNLGKQ